MSIQKVKERTYVETEFLGANVGCVSTEQGLILIDTPYIPSEIHQWKEYLDKLNDNGIAYVINTHHHFDHCLGNIFYSLDVIAHQLCYEEMSKPDGTRRDLFVSANQDLSDKTKKQIYAIPISLPLVTFNKNMWLHMDDANFKLIHTGGHTESSIIVYFVEDKILFSGDNVVVNRHPYKGQANFRKWIEVLEAIQDMDIDVIVSGHGEICDKAEAGRLLDYFKQMQERVLELRNEGCNRDLVIQRAHDLINFYPIEEGKEAQHSFWFDEGIGRLYDEIETASKKD